MKLSSGGSSNNLPRGLVILLFLTFGCSFEKPKEVKVPDNALARVNNNFLLAEDLQGVVPAGVVGKDSQFIVGNFVQTWIKEQLVAEKALKKLSKGERDKDKELKAYYNSLIRYDYLHKEMSGKLDTAVTAEEIKAYYSKNQKNFELKRNIVRLLYVKLTVANPSLPKARLWVRRHNSADMVNLRKLCRQSAVNYTLDTASWFYLDNITKEVPIIESYNPEHFIKYNNYEELKDRRYQYLIYLVDRRIRDEVSPLALERARIKNILLNIKQVKLVKELENSIYKEGSENDRFEIYDK